MRRLIATVTAALLVVPPARADVPTIDIAEIAQTINTLNQLKQEYQAVMGVFGSLLRVVDPNSMAQNLIDSQPLPGGSQISSLLTGSGNFGSLSGLANQFQSANTVYMPQSTGASDFNAALMQRTGNTLAGVQAMVQQSIGSIQTHIAGLVGIQSDLSSVTTEADLTAINGRLQAEQSNLAAQGVQAQSLQTMLMAQQQQYELQHQQLNRLSADSVVAYYGGSSTPAPPTVTAANLSTFNAGP